MKKIKLYLWVLLATIGSCKEPPEPESDDFPIDFKYRLLNSKGEETTTFKEGENIAFSFVATNKTNQELYVNENFVDALVCDSGAGNHGYGTVFQLVGGGQTKFVERVSCLPPLGCNGLSSIRFSPLEKVEIKYYWLPTSNNCENKNLPLQKGRYRTGIKYSFSIHRGIDEPSFPKITKTFEINFDVQ